jgi:hypothetical protein
MTLPFRCGVCRKELHGLWAVLSRTPFPVCSRCRLTVHHACLATADPPVCRRCADGAVQDGRSGGADPSAT